ncbi:MFS transporter [Sphingomonas sp. M1-B02]|uniref:MFS transporter n=1 Tax=Sphingomonas sp. M1-B02 TaxID=3114300 RepID=UPI0022401621|nr:MFS transporter [Sphingomonas sp. S6-11]UZK65932.1 MFS transporter [Sphingomonas sp. S6-11]
MEEAKPPRHLLLFVGMIVFVDMAGIGLITPVMPSLVMGLTGATIDRAAEIGGWLFFCYATMQFLFAPVIGGLSDRFGRRPVLLVTLAALGIDYALMAWAPTLGWLVAGRLISGVMGATFAAANSCVADVVPPGERGRAFGMLGGAGAAGFVLGPTLGGLLGHFGDRVPFVAASMLVLAGALFGWFVLQETLPVERRRAFTPARANPIGSLIQMRRAPLVIGCLAAGFLMQLASQAQLSVWAYQGIARFGWSIVTIGLTITLFGILMVAVQGFGSGIAIRRFGPVRTALGSLGFGVISYLMLAFAPSTAVIVAALVVGAIPGVAFPAMQQLMTARVAEDQQGELQGAIASVISLTAILGPPLMTGVFGAFADGEGLYFPGAPFLLSAGIIALGVAVLGITLRRFGGSGEAVSSHRLSAAGTAPDTSRAAG